MFSFAALALPDILPLAISHSHCRFLFHFSGAFALLTVLRGLFSARSLDFYRSITAPFFMRVCSYTFALSIISVTCTLGHKYFIVFS
jgi:hypothetical protein